MEDTSLVSNKKGKDQHAKSYRLISLIDSKEISGGGERWGADDPPLNQLNNWLDKESYSPCQRGFNAIL